MEFTKENLKLEDGLKKEWLITNGMGGFASSTIIGANTRKYHGLLIAPLTPPAQRYLILSKVDESIKIEDVTVDLITFTLVICITNVNELIYNTKVRVKDNVGLIVSSGLTLIFMLIFLTLTYLSSFIEGITNFVTIFIATLLLALGNFFLTCKMIDNNILYIDGDN